jgi:hypothetical protein
MKITKLAFCMLAGLGATSAFAQDVFVRGTFNQWDATPMVVDGDLLTIDVNVTSTDNPRFKFDFFGDWTENYGDDDLDRIADRDGDDILFTEGTGAYTITFDLATNAYSVTLSDPEEEEENNNPNWQRTVIFIFGETENGQDMFVRGGIDHNFANTQLGRNCSSDNFECAIPVRHLNLINNTTAPWKAGDEYLDWYGAESLQDGASQGTPLDWTTNLWPADWGTVKTVANDGFGEEPLNQWGSHYWMLDVEMDCSATVDGWFELKSFISNGPGWEGDVAQSGTPYQSGNHFARCGSINKFERGSSNAEISQFPDLNDPCTSDINALGNADGDAIPTCAEREGALFNGMDVFGWGARPDVFDIFVEADWMDTTDQGVIPQREALEMVKASFAKEGYALHFDVGDLFDQAPGINPANMDLGGGNVFPFTPGISIGTNFDSRVSAVDVEAQNFTPGRDSLFYYMIFANSQNANGNSGSSGVAWINGTTSIITLGSWFLNRNTEESTNRLINYQAGTIMHEFGHNLGLRHGGNENTNYKPNYLSVMNYHYQLRGMPTIGATEGDRYFARYFAGNANCGSWSVRTLVNSPYKDFNNYMIDYSHGESVWIDERNVDEEAGHGHELSQGIDYNCNGSNTDFLTSYDVNRDNLIGILNDHDDWGSLHFAHLSGGAASGLSENVNPLIMPNAVAQQHASPTAKRVLEVIHEEAPSKAFFNELRKLEMHNH